jgi:hypothetical protein
MIEAVALCHGFLIVVLFYHLQPMVAFIPISQG